MSDNLAKLEEKGRDLWKWGHVHTYLAGAIVGGLIVQFLHWIF
jgi:hypothetical protein